MFIACVFFAQGAQGGMVLADGRADYVGGSTNGDTSAIINPTDTFGTGRWDYMGAADPVNGPFSPLEWDSGLNLYERPGANHSDGVFAIPLIGDDKFASADEPADDELLMHPSLDSIGYKCAVLRWTAGAGEAGLVEISGNVRKLDSGGSGSNGVDFHIYLNGVPIYAEWIASSDKVGESFCIEATIAVGSTVDFAVGPHETNVNYDSTGVKTMVTLLPEPGTVLLLGLGGMLLMRKAKN